MRQGALLFGEVQHLLVHTRQMMQDKGPAWSNSLFLEDNAEFGYGMWTASQARRSKLAKRFI